MYSSSSSSSLAHRGYDQGWEGYKTTNHTLINGDEEAAVSENLHPYSHCTKSRPANSTYKSFIMEGSKTEISNSCVHIYTQFLRYNNKHKLFRWLKSIVISFLKVVMSFLFSSCVWPKINKVLTQNCLT